TRVFVVVDSDHQQVERCLLRGRSRFHCQFEWPAFASLFVERSGPENVVSFDQRNLILVYSFSLNDDSAGVRTDQLSVLEQTNLFHSSTSIPGFDCYLHLVRANHLTGLRGCDNNYGRRSKTGGQVLRWLVEFLALQFVDYDFRLKESLEKLVEIVNGIAYSPIDILRCSLGSVVMAVRVVGEPIAVVCRQQRDQQLSRLDLPYVDSCIPASGCQGPARTECDR